MSDYMERARTEAERLTMYTPDRELNWLFMAGARWARDVLAPHEREVAARALRDAAVSMRAHKDPGHWNLRDEVDPAGCAQSPDAWLEVRAGRIERARILDDKELGL